MAIGDVRDKIKRFFFFHITTWPNNHGTRWVGSPHLKPLHFQFCVTRSYDKRDVVFSILILMFRNDILNYTSSLNILGKKQVEREKIP